MNRVSERIDGRIVNKRPYSEQKAVAGTEGRREDRVPSRGQRAIDGTEGCRGDRGR